MYSFASYVDKIISKGVFFPIYILSIIHHSFIITNYLFMFCVFRILCLHFPAKLTVTTDKIQMLGQVERLVPGERGAPCVCVAEGI